MNLTMIRVLKRYDDDTNGDIFHPKFKSVKRSTHCGEAKSKKNPLIVAKQIGLNEEAVWNLYVSLLIVVLKQDCSNSSNLFLSYL